MIQHYNCGGELAAINSGVEYKCVRCGKKLEDSVVERYENFRRVAERGGPASDIAKVALKGY